MLLRLLGLGVLLFHAFRTVCLFLRVIVIYQLAKSNHAAANKEQFDLFLHLTWLIEVRELGFFRRTDLLVQVNPIVEFESVIRVCEVPLQLFLDFPVGFNPLKKVGVVFMCLPIAA